MIKVLIIDDVEDGRNLLNLFLKNRRDIDVVGLAANVDEAILLTREHTPDLVMLDIMMPGKDGFAYIDELKRYKLSPAIIFVSASENYAIRAIRIAAFDYLLKPLKKAEVLSVIDRFIEHRDSQKKPDYKQLLDLLSSQKPGRIRLNTRSGYFFLDPSEIIFIEADGNYSHLQLMSGKRETTTMNLGSLGNLLDNQIFLRISRSFMINTRFISRVDKRNNICELESNGHIHRISIPSQKTKLLEDFF